MEPADGLVERVLREALMGPQTQVANPTISVKGMDGWLVSALSAGIVIAAVLAGMAIRQADDARDEVRALRIEVSQKIDSERLGREADVRELRQKDGALQAYINAGRVPAPTKGK